MTQPAALVFRPAGWSRRAGWAIIVFGVLFGLIGIGTGDIGGLITVAAAGLVFALCGVSLVISSVTCDSQGIKVRSLYSTYVPAAEVTAVEVAGTNFGYGNRVRVDIRRRHGRTLKSSALMRYDTAKNRAQAEADADAIRKTLGL